MIKIANNLAKVHLKHSAFSDYLQNPAVQYGGGGALVGAGLGALINKLRGESALKGALIGGAGGAGLGLGGYYLANHMQQKGIEQAAKAQAEAQAAKTRQQAEKAQAEAQAAIQKADQENQARVMAGEAGPARAQKDRRMASGGPPPDAAEQGRRAVNEAKMWWDNFMRQVTGKASTPQPQPPNTLFNPQTKTRDPHTSGLPKPMSDQEVQRQLQADTARRKAEYEAERKARDEERAEAARQRLAELMANESRLRGGGYAPGASTPTMFE